MSQHLSYTTEKVVKKYNQSARGCAEHNATTITISINMQKSSANTISDPTKSIVVQYEVGTYLIGQRRGLTEHYVIRYVYTQSKKTRQNCSHTHIVYN